MSIIVRIPTPLQKLTDSKTQVEADGGTIAEVIENLESQYPGIKERLCDENGALRRFVNVYVNEEDVRFFFFFSTKDEDGAEVSIVPAVAWG
ncbi:MAG: MoaD/ThiS family protein [Actinobacteria bacterium]|nr:MoaD/ThiS family protein [Actinomycetota bacterium]